MKDSATPGAAVQEEFLPRPEPPSEQVWLETWLWEHAGWHTVAEICEVTGGKLTDRQVRAAASGSGGIISGQKGLRHLERSTPDEIRHCANDLLSRARELKRRAIRILRRAHDLLRRGGATGEKTP